MKKVIIFLACANLCASMPDFDRSMGKDHSLYSNYYNQGIQNPGAQKMLKDLKAVYEKNFWSDLAMPNTIKIPKKIHQIWLGSPLPEKFKYFTQTWQHYHPDWEYILWTDADIAKLNLVNQKSYDAAINYAERSDIARYEILYRFGGLYVDTDFECIQPFDILHHHYDFYTGLELPAMASFLSLVIIPNGLIGTIASHPIMGACIDAIKNKEGKSAESSDIVVKTGPLLFTDAVIKHAGKNSRMDIIFPATFFYPIDKKIKDKNVINTLIRPETFAMHHWAGSWILKEEAFVPGIKIRCKQEGSI